MAMVRGSRNNTDARGARGRAGTGGSAPVRPLDMHRAWLELVDTDGPFLAAPVLAKVFNTGLGSVFEGRFSAHDDFKRERLEFEAAWDAWTQVKKPDDEAQQVFEQARSRWVTAVLKDAIDWGSHLVRFESTASPYSVSSPDGSVTVSASGTVQMPGQGKPALLLLEVPTASSLRVAPGDGWAEDWIDRTDKLLRQQEVPLGLVTDGRWWALVCSQPGVMTASGVVDALTWGEEAAARDAFLKLLSLQYIVGGDPKERLPLLFADSVAAAEEITEALGAQVRRAVELLIQAFSEADSQNRAKGSESVLPENPDEAYEAAVTVMMRVVFLLFAEERGLLPQGVLFEQGYGIARELDALQKRKDSESEEVLDATSLTWHRLLATSQALYQGSSFENLRMPAYGGSLFDPDRFEFLAAIGETGALRLTVSDRVMLHVLRSVQVAVIAGEARRISFRDIDVEQIGYIYEGLLGYSVGFASGMTLGLPGTAGEEPEVTLEKLEELDTLYPATGEGRKDFVAALIKWVKNDQPSAKPGTAASLVKALKKDPDPTAVSALTQMLGHDNSLYQRVQRWLPLLRTDLRDRPFVVPKGGLLVVETPSRKNAGAHYTPKSLAEEVVSHALEPLCYSPGPYQTNNRDEFMLKSSTEILNLKVADIACGSGAFLVAAARYLSKRVMEAWEREAPHLANEPKLEQRALREVVARCIYGADINSMAVEMCKLSLWLVSLDSKLPFSFVDDKILVGNSLLGVTDLKQISRAHIMPERASMNETFHAVDAESIIYRAINLRHQLASQVDEQDPMRSTAAKKRQLADYWQLTDQLRTMADGVIAAGLEVGGKPGKALDTAYENLRIALQLTFNPEPGEQADDSMLAAIMDRGLTPTVATDYDRWQPLHWALEAPDVVVERGGFDAVIGNPPFLGGQKLTGAMGDNIRSWFVEVIADGTRGSADFVAYFFLRAQKLLNEKGTLGLIATNTLAQGVTREVALESMVNSGFTITHANQSKEWPSASANLEYAAVWGTQQQLAETIDRWADGMKAPMISTLLEPVGKVGGEPLQLQENENLSYQGVIVLGKGFVLTSDNAQKMIQKSDTNRQVVRPYLGGEELNSNPDLKPKRFVIDFYLRSESEAQTYLAPFEWVKENVYEERRSSKHGATNWWRFLRPRPALRKAITDRQLREIFVVTRVSNTLMPARVGSDQVIAESIVVIAMQDYSNQAVLSSDVHKFWAINYSSTMRNDTRYSATDAFETFPRPAASEATEHWGHVLDEERREIMLRRQLGLTKLYNLVNNPDLPDDADADVARLREIHRQVDRAVADAYGWQDLALNHGFYTYKKITRYSISPAARLEVLDRLLAENHRRAALEEAAEQAKSASAKSKRNSRSSRAKSGAAASKLQQKESLF